MFVKSKVKFLFYPFVFLFYSHWVWGQKPFAVIELFTSEGCSSCPPAESVLQQLKADAAKKMQDVFFLEYHVDYWNRLGWKDPYSSFQFTMRQENYTSALSEKTIYTPMLLVNGEHPVTGSDAKAVEQNINAGISEKHNIELSVSVDSVLNDTIFVSYKSTKADKNYFLRLAVTENNIVSKIGKGENSGKTLKHEAVVRIFTTVELRQNEGKVVVPLKKFIPDKNCDLVVFIQHKQTMKIIAATSQRF